MSTWDDALDRFEAAVTALSDALASGDWDHVAITPAPIDELVTPTEAQLARLRGLDAQWKLLEPMLLDALGSIEAEITALDASRKGRTEYARFS